MARVERNLLRGERLTWGFAAFLLVYTTAIGWLAGHVVGVSNEDAAAAADALQSLLQAHVAVLAVLLPVVLLILQMAERGTLMAVGFVHAADQRFRLKWLFVAGIFLAVRLAIDGIWLTYPWMEYLDFGLFVLFLAYLSSVLTWSLAGLASPTRRREIAEEVLREQLNKAQASSRRILPRRERFEASASEVGISVYPVRPYFRRSESTVLVTTTKAGVVGHVDLDGLSAIARELAPRVGLTSSDEPVMTSQQDDPPAIRLILHVRPGDRISLEDPVVVFENLSPSSVPVDEIATEVLGCINLDPEAAAVADRVADLLDTAVDQTDRAIREGSRHRAMRGLEALGNVLRWSLESSDGEPAPLATAGFTASWFFDALESLSTALHASTTPAIARPVMSAYLEFAAVWEGWEFTDEATRVLRGALQAGQKSDDASLLERLAVSISSSGLGAHRAPDAAWRWSKKYASVVRDALESSDATATELLARAGAQVTGYLDSPLLMNSFIGSRQPVSLLAKEQPEAQAAMILSATRLFLAGWEEVAHPERSEDRWLKVLDGPGSAYDMPGLSVLELALSEDFQARIGAQHWEIFTWGPFGGAGFLTLDARIAAAFARDSEWMGAARDELASVSFEELDDDRVLSIKSRLQRLKDSAERPVQWVVQAVADLDGLLQERRVARPLDPTRLMAVREAWREARGTMPGILHATPRPEGAAVTDKTTFGANTLLPRSFLVESHVMADPGQFGSQIGTQMRREALRFWVETASQHCQAVTVSRSEATSEIRDAVDALRTTGSKVSVLLLNLDLERKALEQLGIPVVAERSWRIQAAMVADFQRFANFYVTSVTGDGDNPVEIRVIDEEGAKQMVTEQAWTREGDWGQLDETERISALRDRVHVRILEEYALKIEDPSAARVIALSRGTNT